MDDTNEDSWLYGTSNPDSTTNEGQIDDKPNLHENLEIKSEAEALAAIQDPSGGGDGVEEAPQEEEEEMGDFEDPAHEMEEDEAATAVADTTDAEAGGGEIEEEQSKQQQQSKGIAGSDDDDDDEDDSDDDINVVIGDIKAAPNTYNIKQRGNLLAAGQTGVEKSKGASQGGKFTIEDFEGVGTINGVAAHEFSIDSLEDKPWRKPGADITDYFNYGFNEETWRAYCERQKRFRVVESGVGLASLTQNLNQSMDRQHGEHGQSGLLPPPGSNAGGSLSGMGDQMQGQNQGLMPPPMGHHHGNLQRIPLGPRPSRPMNNAGSSSSGQTKENAIQVMTAECREYSRPGQMASSFAGPPPVDEPFFPEPDPFDYGYEPTQESQWGNNDNPGWVPTGIKELTPGPTLVQPPPQMSGPPGVPPAQQMPGPPQMRGPPPPQMMSGMPPNMPMGPPPPHVMGPMMMGPAGGPVRMPIMGMMPPQQHGPQMPPNMEHMDERQRSSPSRRNRSRSPHRSRRRSKSPIRQRQRSPTRERERASRSRRSRSSSKARKLKSSTTRRSRSRSVSKSRSKSSRTHRSRSRSQSKSKRSRRSHSRSKSPKTGSSSTSSSKKRSEKTEK